MITVISLLFIFASGFFEPRTMQDNRKSLFSERALDARSSAELKKVPDFGNFPLYFIPNKGQVDKKVLFYAKTSGYTLWITHDGLTFDSIIQGSSKSPQPSKLKRDVSKLVFPGSNPKLTVSQVEITDYTVNYITGKDPSKWKADIATSRAVLYKDIFKNIDLKFYGIEKQVEYDWIVKPGADPGSIRFQYKGVSQTSIDKTGNLLVGTSFGRIIHKKPACYQVIDEKKVVVTATFKKVGENTFGFQVDAYDKNYELVIDPVVCLSFSTYLGGSGDDNYPKIAIDSHGCSYIAGATYSNNFPIMNPYQATRKGNSDIFVTKLSATGGLIYSTYLGGSSEDKDPNIAVDNNDYAYITGKTRSTDFPTKNCFQCSLKGASDAFVTKLSREGNTIIYSTYLGGSSDDNGRDIIVDSHSRAYVTGETSSTDFPLFNAIQPIRNGSWDAFITKFSAAGNTLEYSTYLGGTGAERGIGITIDPQDNIYVCGCTNSTNFPTVNAYQNVYKGNYDGFITKISRTGEVIIYSTYIGGASNDKCFDIALDVNLYAYVTGVTTSTNFPTTLNPFQSSLKGPQDAFVTKLSQAGNSLIYSTYLGGSAAEEGSGIAVDSSGSAYITGYTTSTDYAIKNPYQKILKGTRDAIVTKFSPTGKELFFSTYFGGSLEDYGYGIAVDIEGYIYLTGYTNSTDFPVRNAYQDENGGVYDVFVSKLYFRQLESILSVDKTLLNFSIDDSGKKTGPQKILIRNTGKGSLNWVVSESSSWITCSPASGSNFGVIEVSLDNTSSLAYGKNTTSITVSDPYATGSPQTIYVTITRIAPSTPPIPNSPFGYVDTPVNNANVFGGVPFTGWALDDIEVTNVYILRESGFNLIYVGDATFIEGARPDVAQIYPQYPNSNKAGWGYVMLTNLIPDGTHTFHVVAADKEGNNVQLGKRTLIINNAASAKPFGNIDTPAPGGVVSGGAYVIFGWALTPLPNTIDPDGVFIYVDGVNIGNATYVDGVNIGNAIYGDFRQDIYDLFPTYNNAGGAGFHYYFNSRGYTNGIHSLVAVVNDNADNTQGIGSRYFNIWNLGTLNSQQQESTNSKNPQLFSEIDKMPLDYSNTVKLTKGYDPAALAEPVYPDEQGNIYIEAKEMERMAIHLKEQIKGSTISCFEGYLAVGNQLWKLPVGSTLDKKRGIFYWQPGPGFIGRYNLVFTGKWLNGKKTKINIAINILPLFNE